MRLLLALLFLSTYHSYAQTTSLLIEGGALWQERNDVQIPPNTGTLVSFDEYDKGPFFHYRFEGHYQTDRGHGLRLIYAPLSLSVTGEERRDVIFNGKTFSKNTPITVDYKFNSYRLGYTYRLIGDKNNFLKFGITGKIRQASIRFKQGTLSSEYDNVGFVPLLYYALKVQFSNQTYLFSDADFAFASQGRAVDITMKLRRDIVDSISFGIGVRALEGGAENDKVLTFTFAQYAVADLLIQW